MTFDPALQPALRARLQFCRDLGLGSLYRREASDVSPQLNLDQQLVDVPPSHTETLPAEPHREAHESHPSSPGDVDRDALLKIVVSDIGPDCQRCKLGSLGRKQIVFGTGDPDAELMFVGEGPGADEDQQGLPFVGRAGQLLNNMIAAMGLKREQVYIANIVKCRPPGNRTPERDECDTCSPFLMRQIGIIRPRIIVALGATAAKNLLGVADSMASLRGRLYEFSPPGVAAASGEPFTCKLSVTYHPAFLLRDPRQKKEAWKDLQGVMRELGLPIPQRPPVE